MGRVRVVTAVNVEVEGGREQGFLAMNVEGDGAGRAT